ncbi:MAG: hypothetical protein QM723_01140 [Myxococcaceae bacterium]
MVLMLCGADALAKCATPSQLCGCTGFLAWVVTARATDASHATVLETFGHGAPDAGSSIVVASDDAISAGQLLVVDANGIGHLLADDGGTFVCSGVGVPTDVWCRTLLDGGCEHQLTIGGLDDRCVDPDVTCSCASGSGLAICALLLLVNLRRRLARPKRP